MVNVAGGGATGNVAVTAASAFIVTIHVPVPPHPAPSHPVNQVPVAVKVTIVSATNAKEQVPAAVQLIPAGFDVTVPLLTTVTANVLNDVRRCASASMSETVSWNPAARSCASNVGIGVKKFGSVEGMVAGSGEGSTITLLLLGEPPRVSSSRDKFTTRRSVMLVAPKTESAVTCGPAVTDMPIGRPPRLNVTMSPGMYWYCPVASV
jgi:hypothetical protein